MFAYARMRVRGWKKCVDRNLAAFSDLGLENGLVRICLTNKKFSNHVIHG